MYKSASYFNQRLANVKTSYSKELLAQNWVMKSLPSDRGMKNTLMSRNACSGENHQTAGDSNWMKMAKMAISKNLLCYILNLGATSFIT